MTLHLIHTEASQQPVAATVAKEIQRSLPEADVCLSSVNEPAEVGFDDVVLAIFSVKNGAFAPIVPFYQDLRDKKVAFLAVLSGPVDASRVRKTVWGIKKQFCGNEVLAGYLCPAQDDMAGDLTEAEKSKALDFAQKLYDEHIATEEKCLAVNY